MRTGLVCRVDILHKLKELLEIRKSLNESLRKDSKLEYFKREILEILNRQEEKEVIKSLDFIDYFYVEKANFGVGHVSTYKDGSMWRKTQNNPPRWKCIRQTKNYSSETSGIRQSITKLKNKVRDCKTTDELLDIVMFNFSRFTDENGQLLPITEKLAAEITRQKAIIKGLELKGISFGNEVQDWIVSLASSAGVDIKGFRYRLTKDFEAHAINEHGDFQKESNRGQSAITKNDIVLINTVIDNPDFAVVGVKKNGQDSIILCKNDGRGGSVLVAEVLTSKKNRALNAKTYWIMKKPVKKEQLEKILNSNGNYNTSNIKIAAAVAVNSTGLRSMNSAKATNPFHANGNSTAGIQKEAPPTSSNISPNGGVVKKAFIRSGRLYIHKSWLEKIKEGLK